MKFHCLLLLAALLTFGKCDIFGGARRYAKTQISYGAAAAVIKRIRESKELSDMDKFTKENEARFMFGLPALPEEQKPTVAPEHKPKARKVRAHVGQVDREMHCEEGVCFTKVYEWMSKGVTDESQLDTIKKKSTELSTNARSAFEKWLEARNRKGLKTTEKDFQLFMKMTVEDLPGVDAPLDMACDSNNVCKYAEPADIENKTLTILVKSGDDVGEVSYVPLAETSHVRTKGRNEGGGEELEWWGRMDPEEFEDKDFKSKVKHADYSGNWLEWINVELKNVRRYTREVMMEVKGASEKERLDLLRWINYRYYLPWKQEEMGISRSLDTEWRNNDLRDRLGAMGKQWYLDYADYYMYGLLVRMCHFQSAMKYTWEWDEKTREKMFRYFRHRYNSVIPRQLFVLNEQKIQQVLGCTYLWWNHSHHMNFMVLHSLKGDFLEDMVP
jgi:hypothetical protein